MPTIFMLQTFCRQDGGIASPPPFVPHQPFQNRTITLAFRSVSVYVCLYGFTFALSPSLFVGEWACPSHCIEPFHSRNRCKRTTTLRPAPTLPKPHYPLLCTITLASLVKGRWIDGTTQALILLLSACDMPTIFMLQTFLPSRRRDCFTPTNLSKAMMTFCFG